MAAVSCALVLTGCGGPNDDKSLPRVDPTRSSGTADPSTKGSPTESAPTSDPPTKTPSTPTVSPPPEGANLDAAQRSAYRNALHDDQTIIKVISSFDSDPEPTTRTAERIADVTYLPISQQYFETIQRYAKARVHVEGAAELFWSVPVEVDLSNSPRPMIKWKSCAGRGTLRVIKANGKEIPQEDGREVYLNTQYADEDGFWRASDSKRLGTC